MIKIVIFYSYSRFHIQEIFSFQKKIYLNIFIFIPSQRIFIIVRNHRSIISIRFTVCYPSSRHDCSVNHNSIPCDYPRRADFSEYSSIEKEGGGESLETFQFLRIYEFFGWPVGREYTMR